MCSLIPPNLVIFFTPMGNHQVFNHLPILVPSKAYFITLPSFPVADELHFCFVSSVCSLDTCTSFFSFKVMPFSFFSEEPAPEQVLVAQW